jgi:phosphatase NudJ
MTQGIDVTVAAVVEREGRFLVVEERVGGHLVINQPAGHLEHGESLVEAVVRETREETAHGFTPEHVVGFYLWQSEGTGTTFLRVNFCGRADPPPGPAALDEGIVAVHWLSRAQLTNGLTQLRSPMVLRAVDDYLAGRRYPLDCLTHLSVPPLAGIKVAGA